jgi:hypothetical protein
MQVEEFTACMGHAAGFGHAICQSASNSFQLSASKFFQLLRLI